MQLPRDNGLELDPGNDEVLDAGAPIALTDEDVLRLLPAWVRRSPTRLRDAVVQTARRFWTRVQRRIGRVLGALQSPRHATGFALAAHGEVRQRPQAPGEGEPAYRERLLVRPQKITPNAMRSAVTALVLARTPIPPVLFEPATEGVFVQAEWSQEWMCFYQPVDGPILWAEMPDNAIPAGAWVGPEADVTRPVFVVYVQGPLYELDPDITLYNEHDSVAGLEGAFAGADTGPVAWSFVGSEEPPLVEQVLREVEARRGAGVLWWMVVVPDLGGAL